MRPLAQKKMSWSVQLGVKGSKKYGRLSGWGENGRDFLVFELILRRKTIFASRNYFQLIPS